jgi:hypothetical protein
MCTILIEKIRVLRDQRDPNKKKPSLKKFKDQRYPSMPSVENKENTSTPHALKLNFIDTINKVNPNTETPKFAHDDDEEFEQNIPLKVSPHPGVSIVNNLVQQQEEEPIFNLNTLAPTNYQPISLLPENKPKESSKSEIKDVLRMILDINTVKKKSFW